MKRFSVMRALAGLTVVLTTSAYASDMSWTYGDVRYLHPSEGDSNGVLAEFSGNIARNWVLQARVNHQALDNSAVEVTQTRYDLSGGWLLGLGNNVDALLSLGYTHVDYRTETILFSQTLSDDLGNVGAALRARIAPKLEADVSLGVLFDKNDTSDLLWSVGARYRAFKNMDVQFGVNGADSEINDAVTFELGIRFDLAD